MGVADVELPTLESMSEAISGAGIAGEIESPNIGHYGSMTTTINWRVLEKSYFQLASQESHHIDFRGSIKVNDMGIIKQIPLKVTIRGVPKSLSLGNLTVGSPMENSTELETTYIKILYDGQEMVEIDKYNFICKINGVDVLADVRKNIGL